jgi:molybdopterin molybdotransferase
MAEFLRLLSPREALARLMANLSFNPTEEEVDTSSALGRVVTSPVTSPHPLPAFPRSTVDGFAVRAEDTFGASDSLPAYLGVIGEVTMGSQPDFSLIPGTCALIHTGGMLPEGSDAVIMVEFTQTVQVGEIEALRAVSVGENILKEGEDVAQGEVVIEAGVRLGPAEIGGLMALGITRIAVARRPRVGILSSGDEVVSPKAEVSAGQVRDVNSYSLSALIEQAGGISVRYGIIADDAEKLFQAASLALQECDMVVITAGSSASIRDLTSQAIDALGKPGVLVHGVNVKPGKPTILAACAEAKGTSPKPVIGLPGNPVSALVIAYLFILPTLYRMQGMAAQDERLFLQAKITLNLSSQAGREDWVPVKLRLDRQTVLAEPVFGKSNLIFTLVRADGLAYIPADATGVEAGDLVQVFFF